MWIMIVMLDNSQARVDDVACPEYKLCHNEGVDFL